MTFGSHVTTVLLLRKKLGEKPGMRRIYFDQDHFRTGSLPVTSLCHFRSKVTPRVDITQLPVVHAQNILPDMVTSCHVTYVTSGHVTSGHVTDVTSGHAQWSDPPQILICRPHILLSSNTNPTKNQGCNHVLRKGW